MDGLGDGHVVTWRLAFAVWTAANLRPVRFPPQVVREHLATTLPTARPSYQSCGSRLVVVDARRTRRLAGVAIAVATVMEDMSQLVGPRGRQSARLALRRDHMTDQITPSTGKSLEYLADRAGAWRCATPKSARTG